MDHTNMSFVHWQPALPEHYLRTSADELSRSIEARRQELGDRLIILGHHYQADAVIQHADFTGDSLKLAQLAATRAREQQASYIIFCGVHFMAESADLLTSDDVAVILPDLSAGCSMADMADYDDVLDAWDALHESLEAEGWTGTIVPITYVNSSAAVKAFVGAHGGAVCTSSNADRVFEWAMTEGAERSPGGEVKILFLPDQHLGRNTAAAFGMDVQAETCVYDPKKARAGDELGGMTAEELARSKVILWAGHCSVHMLFRAEHCDELRRSDPDVQILVHPECCKEVVDRADLSGSTEFIIGAIRDAPAGSRWAVGTEAHLVNRLAREAHSQGVEVRSLSECQCMCTTMYRIDEPHLLWALDNLAQGKVVNQIRVHPDVREPALAALDRMLSLTNAPAPV